MRRDPPWVCWRLCVPISAPTSRPPSYVVGPLAGALIAGAFAWILRGPGGDPGALAAARDTLDR
jgi:hypothetical protein